ncbi:hypothetical protein MVEN_02153500 [Mycena venus]|uniref:MYND-type domain-containing protein n=1 Tax=Mycena venus TaxID=2733690 RepID=A0A8H6X9J1_9AGAR|nr:hypothetical protein MVEN_02153500 [Mycena venus]
MLAARLGLTSTRFERHPTATARKPPRRPNRLQDRSNLPPDAHEYKSHIQPLSNDLLEKLKDWLRTSAQLSLDVIRPNGTPSSSNYRYHEKIFYNIVTVLNILDGQLKSEAMQLSLTRREVFDRYASKHEGKMTTRFECARCQTVAYCCKVHQKEDWRGKSSFVFLPALRNNSNLLPGHKKRCFETTY